MYTACIHCHAHLGTNEVIERFPVGRRLAFDPIKGRLWVVCRACARWNLTPLEERWEAIDHAERRFRGTRLRASTDNIGLARLPEGLELVRVGRTERRELASWRYADFIARRHRRALIAGGVATAALIAAGYGLGGVALQLVGVAYVNRDWFRNRRVVGRFAAPSGAGLRAGDLDKLDIRAATHDTPLVLELRDYARKSEDRSRYHVRAQATGGDATVLLARVLAYLNRRTGRRRHLQGALGLLEELGDPLRAPAFSARYLDRVLLKGIRGADYDGLVTDWQRERRVAISLLPAEFRLALEMAANEETERRALEGELAALEAAWKDAEEIASLADDMFLPSTVREFIDRHRPSSS